MGSTGTTQKPIFSSEFYYTPATTNFPLLSTINSFFTSSFISSQFTSQFDTSPPMCENYDILNQDNFIESINNQANQLLPINLISDTSITGWSPNKLSDYIDFKFINPLHLFKIQILNGSNVRNYMLQFLFTNSEQIHKMVIYFFLYIFFNFNLGKC